MERGIGEDRVEYNYYLGLLESESIEHLFWWCQHIEDLIQKVYRWVNGFDWLRGNETMNYTDFIMGKWTGVKSLTELDLVWKHLVKFVIFQCRLRRKIPSFGDVIHELGEICRIFNLNRRVNYIEYMREQHRVAIV